VSDSNPLARARDFVAGEWSKIDADYRAPAPSTGEAAAILLTVAAGLILPHYVGNPTAILKVPAAQRFIAEQSTPELYPHLYWALFKLVNYFLLPALCIKLVLKQRIRDFGFDTQHSAKVWALYVGMALAVLPIAYAVSFSPAFLRTYPKFAGAAGSWSLLVSWELAYGLQFFLLEFFFRGFFLFALARHLGAIAIFVMVVPYSMIHFGKPPAECVGSVVAGVVLGTIALRTRSIYGGVLVHCTIAWSMDLFALLHKGELQRLLAH